MKRLLTALVLCVCTLASAQVVTVKDTTIRTYNFSDPDPVARTGRIYPYNRFETFAFDGEDVTWKMVVLENDFLRVKIFPEIGGKVWSVYDKKECKELFYDNSVIKFRDISMRGPWTSGGIEFNYGIIGHAPSCASPVDWKTEKKADGSVSCYIGVQELVTRTRWMVEINLPKDAVWLRTRTLWHNYSGVYQPYYNWANSGVTASEDLRLIYPATYTIGHDGQTTPYPFDEGHDYSRYSDQKFGRDKSLHPGGSHKGYFGAYWEGQDFGMLHYALRDEKLGRKYFTWALSDEGMIWVDLLTDTNPQYVELQAGRLFNQNMITSDDTPFKQFLFTPYGTDEWNEYWLPFSGIGGVDDMSLRAVVNVAKEGEGTRFGIYPLQNMEGTLEVKDEAGKVLVSEQVSLKASEPCTIVRNLSSAPKTLTVAGARLWSSDSQQTDRPDKINAEFEKNSAQGFAVYARCHIGMANWTLAEACVDSALVRNPSFVEALDMKAMLCCRNMDYKGAYEASNKVLAIDSYDPQANYFGGLAAMNLGKLYDAMDRFELAALTSELRSAAQTKLAQIRFVMGDRDLACEYARKSLVSNQYNLTALELIYQCTADQDVLAQIEALDPVCHFPAIERYLAGSISAEALYDSIFEEMKWQNYLEHAAFYHGLGLDDKAVRILEACPEENALLSIWTAFLKGDASAIAAAESKSLDLVFPFRAESCAPLKWAVDNGGKWQSRYLLAMLSDFLGDKEAAKSLMDSNDSDFAPYYSYRYSLTFDRADIERARSLDPEQWRYVRDLVQKLCSEGDHAAAIKVAAPYYNAHKDNFHVTDVYVRALVGAGQYAKADKVMDSMRVLPFEGQSGTRALYRDIKLRLAQQCIDKKQWKAASKYVEQARQWPSRLGSGKPYDEFVNTAEEDRLTEIIKSHL